jgi:hypothetical protein
MMVQQPLPTSTTPLAAVACLNCRRGHRKCDKTLPKCSLCNKLGKECVYDYSIVKRHNPYPPTQSIPTLKLHPFSVVKIKDETIDDKLMRLYETSMRDVSQVPIGDRAFYYAFQAVVLKLEGENEQASLMLTQARPFMMVRMHANLLTYRIK